MLPFVAGLAVGVGAVVAYSNRDKLKEMASEGYEKGKEFTSDLKDSASETIDCVKEKLDKKKTSKKEEQEDGN